MGRPIRSLIDGHAIASNLSLLKNKSRGCKVIAVVKNDGYGHGIINIISSLEQADALAVSSIEEAMKLRRLTNKAIFLLGGFFNAEELPAIEHNKLKLVLHSPEQFRILMNTNSSNIDIWIKVNTGMNRLGFCMDDVVGLCKQFDQLSKNNISVEGLLTHFACSDELEHDLNKKQIETFDAIRSIIRKDIAISLSNSAAVLSGIARNEWIRPGIALYGASPFINKIGADFGLLPAMTLMSELISTRFCLAGDMISYGAEYACPENMLVGIVAVGYGDGYPRHATAGTPVLINDVLVPLIGRVCMDMIMIDLRKCKNAKVGDQVTLWGKNLPIEIIAKQAGTIPNHLMTAIASRVPRNIEFN